MEPREFLDTAGEFADCCSRRRPAGNPDWRNSGLVHYAFRPEVQKIYFCGFRVPQHQTGRRTHEVLPDIYDGGFSYLYNFLFKKYSGDLRLRRDIYDNLSVLPS